MAGVIELVVFLVIVYLLYYFGAFTMVDVLSARMQAVYTNWDQKPKTLSAQKISANNLRRYSQLARKENLKSLTSDNLFQYKERELFRTKETPWTIRFPPKFNRPLMGLACTACTPNSKDFSYDLKSINLPVQNILKTHTETSNSFFTRAFCHIVYVLQLKKFHYAEVFDKVLANNILKSAVEDTTKELVINVLREKENSEKNYEETYKKIFKAQEARAKKILTDMKSTISTLLLKFTAWLLFKLLPMFLTSVCLHPAQLEMMQKAASTNLPLIFVPLHRSHLDYILITFLIQNIGIKPPLVAAGNNLNIPVFGKLLRGLGAFFIKRRLDPVAGKKDTLYRAALQTYMIECLKAGHNIEFYVEGGRTRTGKPCMPKGGLLSVIVSAYMDGTVEDALLVPISINYDKLVDGNFESELLGRPKQMETFTSAISAIWTTLNSNYGSIRIDFNQPFSLRELVKSFQNVNKARRVSQLDLFSNVESDSKKIISQKSKIFRSSLSTTSLYGTDVVDEDHRSLVDKIARHLIYDSSKACAIMSTNVVAFLMLNKHRDGVFLEELIESFDKLRQLLLSDNTDFGFSGESEDVTQNAIKLLGSKFLKTETRIKENSSETIELITPFIEPPKVFALTYYSNTLVNHFKLEGIVATAISCSIQSEGSQYVVSMDDIMKKALDLCDIFQFEFIFFKPCCSLETVISETVDKFVYMDILSTQEGISSEYKQWSQNVAKNFEDSEEDEFDQHKPPLVYIINSGKEEDEKLELFHMMFRPLVEAYLTTAMCLRYLIDKQLTENEFYKDIVNEVITNLETGFCSYGESSSVELIKNAVKLFNKWNVVEIYNQYSMKLIYLSDSYKSEEHIEPIISRIRHYKFLNK